MLIEGEAEEEHKVQIINGFVHHVKSCSLNSVVSRNAV